ncbi:uncharacterized protein PV09_00361 [Verruconis gallopava]|uniref:N-acetylglucosamine-induced protein 1 n=1 Tax=Verruconis gallopava TaxID=253628 RepID=A0A0D2AS38_9PEZI|nr:uncharacterized protein PV09_00361 [Verruconis gallopava]KIW09483.1 hypothetical protein PV09_00361 [Verruconis gallopava]
MLYAESDMAAEKIQWFNYNLPKEEWTEECPESLRDASAKDRGIIGSLDEDFKPMSWEEVKHLVAINRIDKFQRSPSELRRYRQYIYHLKKNYGSVMNFIIKHRLQWSDVNPTGPPFSNPDDIKVLYNDWPYGIDKRIVHLVVWVKFDIEDDPETDRLTPSAWKQIQDYVNETFCSQMNPDHVVWFKNWKSLKSIHAVEHFHVMLYEPDMAFVHSITNGDMPQSAIEQRSNESDTISANGSI